MALPDTLSVPCPLCGQESTVQVQGTQAIVVFDPLTGLSSVNLVVLLDTPSHFCPAVPDRSDKATARKPAAAKKATAKRTAKTA